MQFQNINHQLLEQINTALASLSGHFSQIYALIDGQAPPPPEALEALLAPWADGYVMQNQREAHALALGPAVAGPATGQASSPVLALATDSTPRVEFF